MKFPKPRRRWHKWAITLLFLVVVVPFCAAFVLVSTPWGQERMRDAAVEAIHDELGLTATLEHVDVQVMPYPRVVARGIVLDDPVYGTFAEADGLIIRPSVWALLRGTVDLHSVEIEGPVVNLVLRDGEIRNLPRARSDGGSGDDLPFDELIATGAKITLDAEPLGSAVLEGVNLDIDAGSGLDMDIQVSAVSGEFTHALGTERLQRFHAVGHIAPGSGIDVVELVAWTPHVKVELAESFIPLPFGPGWHGEAHVRVNLAHLDDLPHGWELPPLEGIVDVTAEMAGQDEGVTGTAEVIVEDGLADHRWAFNDVQLKVDVTPERVALLEGSHATLLRDGGRVPLEGTLGLGEGMPLDITVGIEDLEFHVLMEQLGVTPNTIVQWHFDGEAGLRGTLDPLSLEGPIDVDTRDFLVTRGAWHEEPQERVVGVTRARIAGRVSVRPDGLRFERLVADTPRSRLQGDVLIGFDDQLGVEVTSDQLDLADATPLAGFPIGGQGSVQVSVTGNFSDPAVTGHLRFADFAFDTFPLGDIESDAQLEKGGLAVRFPQVTAVKNDSRYVLNDLFLDFSDHRFLAEGGLATERFALSDFYHVFHYQDDERFTDYQGFVSGEASVRYTLGFPGDSPTGTMVADMDLAIPSATINDFAFADGAFRGRWTWKDYEQGYRGGELDIEHLHLTKGDGTLTVTGRMGLGGVLQMTAAADRIDVRDTEGLSDRLPELGGVYSVMGTIEGTAEVPRAHLDVTVTGLSWEDTLIGDGRAYVRMTDRQDEWVSAAEAWDPGNLPEDEECAAARNGLWRGRWAADPPLSTIEGPKERLVRPMAFLVCGDALDGQVKLDMAIGRTQVYPLRGTVELAGLDLGPLLRQVMDGAEAPLEGGISGRITLTGGAMKVDDSLVGRVQLSELFLRQRNVELRNWGEVDVSFDRGDFTVAQAQFTGPSSRLELSGGGSARRGLALEVDGSVDLGLVATLSPRFTQAEGQVVLHVNLTGRVSSPRIYGQAIVADGAFRYAGFEEPLTDLQGLVTFSARRVLFEGFEARMAGGRIQMSGGATLQGVGLERYEFDIDAEGLALSPDPDVQLAFGGHIDLDWQREQRLPLLHGTLRLDRVVYTKDIQLSINQLRQQRAVVEQYAPDEDRVELDLRVVEEQPMRVSNNLIDAEVRIEDSERPFRIVGTDQRFGAVGTLNIERGTVFFRGTDFEVRRGVIHFDDTHRIDPNFDLLAVTDVRRSGDLTGPSWRIELHAHGNRDSFQLDTRSEPELSQEDVVLLLTVGMTRAEAEQLQAGDLGGTAALEALATVTGIDREVQRAVPVIDDFGITSRYSPRTNRTEPQLSVGKRIADRVRLSASTGLSEQREVRTSVEWRLSDQTSVQASYDNVNTTTASTVGNIGVDVRWRLEFE